jgi:hypothetical protein
VQDGDIQLAFGYPESLAGTGIVKQFEMYRIDL